MEFKLNNINPLHHSFKTIGIVGRPRNDVTLQMHKNILLHLQKKGYQVLIEQNIGIALEIDPQYIASIEKIGELSQLVIVIGGDGNMLANARVLAKYNTLVIGINRGNLGFLTDIDPTDIYPQLDACLNGDFFVEERFLLQTQIERNGDIIASGNALNEVVVQCSNVTKMIDFQVYINNNFAFSQCSDGLIVSTPTGSTAYSLSAGGPILTPQLNALSLVSICPHTLSSRPIVIDGDSKISMRFANYTVPKLSLSCDGQIQFEFTSDDVITVQKSEHKFRLIHLNNYNYYNVLRTKLGWLKKLF